MTRRQSPLKASLTVLCIVLMATFSAASTVQALHELEHQWDAAGEHDHHPVNQLAAAFDGSGDKADRDGTAGPGHHHHGDGQPNLPIWASAGICIDRNEDRLAIAPERALSDMPIYGPERPPKHLSASV